MSRQGSGLMLLAAVMVASGGTYRAGAASLSMRAEVAAQMASTPAGQATLVLVTGDTTEHAIAAVEAAGLETVEVFERFDMVAASGPVEEVRAVHLRPGVLRVDANPKLEWLDDIAHRSTGVAQLRDAAGFPELGDLRRPDRTPYDGTGVSIAVVDTGFYPDHEQFVDGGETKVDVHLRQACAVPREAIYYYTVGADPFPDCSLWLPVSSATDPDASGHGTIVAGTAAGYPRATPGGVPVSGVATGARLVGLSVGAGIFISNALSALNWVLEHHADPCGDGSCPPIRVVNNSYGLVADDGVFTRRFDPESPVGRITTALVEEGVVVVFAAGNDGGDGSSAQTNFLALNPIPGFLSVGAYYDANAGDQDMLAWNSSSRGHKGEPATYPDLLAPGTDITIGCDPVTSYCTTIEDPLASYGTFSGTSAAAPYLAGVVAMLLEANLTLTPADIEDILEDSAHQLGRPEDLEPDAYLDYAGNTRGNDDHLTSFDAGHGNVDVVGALGLALQGSVRVAPDLCPQLSSVSIADPQGDAGLLAVSPLSVDSSAHDIVGASASLDAVPGALSVVVTYRDLPEVATVPMHTTVAVALDRGGDLGSGYAELDLDRTITGDSFTIFSGEDLVSVEGTVDPDAATVTYLIRPLGGPVQVRATLMVVWTSTQGVVGDRVDDVLGRCTLWASIP